MFALRFLKNFKKPVFYNRHSLVRPITRYMDNYYMILQVPPNATHEEIKSAYYALSLKYHPDRCQDEHARQQFVKIAEAYQTLSDFQKKSRYDQSINPFYRTSTTEEAKTYSAGQTRFDEAAARQTYNSFKSGQMFDQRKYTEHQLEEDENEHSRILIVVGILGMAAFYYHYDVLWEMLNVSHRPPEKKKEK